MGTVMGAVTGRPPDIFKKHNSRKEKNLPCINNKNQGEAGNNKVVSVFNYLNTTP
jgi:hypothetical protein